MVITNSAELENRCLKVGLSCQSSSTDLFSGGIKSAEHLEDTRFRQLGRQEVHSSSYSPVTTTYIAYLHRPTHYAQQAIRQ